MSLLKIFSPARFDLAGGTLDLPPISSILNNSLTINCTLNRGIYITFSKSEKIIINNENTNVESEFPSKHPDLTLLSKAIEFFKDEILFPFKLSVKSDLPRGSGLGVSSVILVSILKGLAKLLNIEIKDKKLIYIAANIESSLINCPAGLQDYVAPVFGGLNKITFPHSGFEVENLALSETLKNNLLFVYTGISHFSGKPNWELLKLFLEDEKEKEKFKQLAENAVKMEDALKYDNLKLVGKLMKNDFNIRKSFPVKLVPYLPEIFSVLEKCGNIAGFRLCGAAGGGTVAVLTNKGERENVKKMFLRHRFNVLDIMPDNTKFEVVG
jgi:D-glycero-alpha-D-manno-heptose-7-phosphate kinase